MIKPLPPVEYLRECFDYDPLTGELRWRQRPREHFVNLRAYKIWNTRYASTIAGAIKSTGYYHVTLYRQYYLVHRIIWKWSTGEEPPPTIDHIDRNRTNNRWNNLRLATQSQQSQNACLFSNNNSGFRGVSWHRLRKKWRATIGIDGRHHHLGLFVTIEDAAAAYQAAAREAFGEFYRDA